MYQNCPEAGLNMTKGNRCSWKGYVIHMEIQIFLHTSICFGVEVNINMQIALLNSCIGRTIFADRDIQNNIEK